MQILVTHGNVGRTRVFCLNSLQLAGALMALMLFMIVISAALYHFIFITAAREGWPVVGKVVKLVVRDEFAQRDRFMRENLDALAVKVGEIQAKLVSLEAIGERVSASAGLKPDEMKQQFKSVRRSSGQGGPFVEVRSPSLDQLKKWVDTLGEKSQHNADVLALMESRLFESRMQSMMVPSSRPLSGPVGSGFGFRSDPFTGRAALHTGLDFPAPLGTSILSAAGGVVLSVDLHPQYGHMIELDHGNGLITRYAHCSSIAVKVGDIIKRGQLIGRVGSTGRSTGPHLHFEVLLDSVFQDPAKFLFGDQLPKNLAFAKAPTLR
jgi:murein DD-endopeptidase MepM/ murein hydrolase activator NlpD